jgi:hypothetical protein
MSLAWPRRLAEDHAVVAATIATGLIALVLLAGLTRRDQEARHAKAVQAEVGAQVGAAQIHEAAAVGAATEETREQITTIRNRTRRAVARVRATAPRPVLAAAPGHGGDAVERAFFDGVCQSALYRADPACRGERGGPEDPGAAARP